MIFTKSLAYLNGKEEWGVKIFYDRQMLSQQISENDKTLLALKAGATGKSTGLAYFSRKKFSEALEEQVERSSDGYAQDSHNRLTACAEASCLLQNQAKEAAGRQEEMVLNGAYLIEKEKVVSFRAELEKLGQQYGPSGFYYEFTGPWPAYNFAVGAGEEPLEDE